MDIIYNLQTPTTTGDYIYYRHKLYTYNYFHRLVCVLVLKEEDDEEEEDKRNIFYLHIFIVIYYT